MKTLQFPARQRKGFHWVRSFAPSFLFPFGFGFTFHGLFLLFREALINSADAEDDLFSVSLVLPSTV